MNDQNKTANGTSQDHLMQAAMAAPEKVFPGCALVLLVAPFDAPEGAGTNYVSNSKREDVSALLKEVTARFDGRAHDALKVIQ